MKISGNKLRGKRRHKPAIAAVALGALMSFQAGAARADDTAAEIRILKERLKHLEERVAIDRHGSSPLSGLVKGSRRHAPELAPGYAGGVVAR